MDNLCAYLYPGCLNALTFVALWPCGACCWRLVSRVSWEGWNRSASSFPRLYCKRWTPVVDNIMMPYLKYGITNPKLYCLARLNGTVFLLTYHGKNYSYYAKCSRNTTLIWFQDRIVHRILTTNTFASKFMEVCDLCTSCRRERETIEHLMETCVDVDGIWKSIKEMIRKRLNVTMN